MVEKLLMGTRGMTADPVYRRMPDITYDVWQLVVPPDAEIVGDQVRSTEFDPAAPNKIHWWPGKDGQGVETLLCGRVVEARVLTDRDKDFVSIGCAYLEGANAYLVVQPEVGPAFWLVRFAEGAPVVEEEGSGKSYYYFVASPKALHRCSLTGTFDLKEELIHPHFDAGCSHKVDPHTGQATPHVKIRAWKRDGSVSVVPSSCIGQLVCTCWNPDVPFPADAKLAYADSVTVADCKLVYADSVTVANRGWLVPADTLCDALRGDHEVLH